MFCSVFLSGSVNTILRVKRSFGVILAIFGNFCKTEKARIALLSKLNTFKYGCHCRFDKSMQQMGRGEPVEAIDSAFKVYKVSSEFKGQLKIKLCSVMFEVRA